MRLFEEKSPAIDSLISKHQGLHKVTTLNDCDPRFSIYDRNVSFAMPKPIWAALRASTN